MAVLIAAASLSFCKTVDPIASISSMEVEPSLINVAIVSAIPTASAAFFKSRPYSLNFLLEAVKVCVCTFLSCAFLARNFSSNS